jgi:hypothetical protein
MARRCLSLLLAISCFQIVADAQVDCTPQPIRFFTWGPPGQRYANGDIVPVGEVWLIQTAGLSSTDGRVLDYMLQHDVPDPAPTCCWGMPLHVNVTSRFSTPVLSLERSVILEAGERLTGRVNANTDYGQMALMYKGWRFPAACTAALLIGGAIPTTFTPPIIPVSEFDAVWRPKLEAIRDKLPGTGEAAYAIEILSRGVVSDADKDYITAIYANLP